MILSTHNVWVMRVKKERSDRAKLITRKKRMTWSLLNTYLKRDGTLKTWLCLQSNMYIRIKVLRILMYSREYSVLTRSDFCIHDTWERIQYYKILSLIPLRQLGVIIIIFKRVGNFHLYLEWNAPVQMQPALREKKKEIERDPLFFFTSLGITKRLIKLITIYYTCNNIFDNL